MGSIFSPSMKIEIRGEVAVSDLEGWTLEICAGQATSGCNVIASGGESISGGIATWDPPDGASGSYTIVLRATTDDGQIFDAVFITLDPTAATPEPTDTPAGTGTPEPSATATPDPNETLPPEEGSE
jgi:hypothetical protein